MTVLHAIDTELIPGAPELLGRVTGESLSGETIPNLNHTHRCLSMLGTDLGIMWGCGDGRLMMAFGDTNGEGWCGNGGGPETADWRSNAVGVAEPFDPDLGPSSLRFAEDRPGHSAEALASAKNDGEHTVIPTSGLMVDGCHFMHYMSVRRFGRPGEWHTNYGGLAFSDDGDRWTKAIGARWMNGAAGDATFQMGALADGGDEFIYLFGTPSGRHGSVSLARVPRGSLLDQGQYQYWDGADWQPGDPGACRPVVAGPVGEMSVAYHAYFDRWIMTHIEGAGSNILLREAKSLTGPWSSGKLLVRHRDWRGSYGGFIDPLHCDGPNLYYTLSLWYKYNVFWMRSRLSAGSAA